MYNLNKRLIYFCNYLSYKNVLIHYIIILSDINYVKSVNKKTKYVKWKNIKKHTNSTLF